MSDASIPGRNRGFLATPVVAHVVCVQVVLAAVLVVPGLTLPQRAGAAAAVVLVGFAYVKGRPLWVWAARWLRWRARRRLDRRAPEAAGPQLELESIFERGVKLGVGYDRRGWFAATTVVSSGEGNLPDQMFPLMAAVLQGTGASVDAVQLVTRTAGAGGDTSLQESWVAVRLNVPGAHWPAGDRGGGEVGVRRALGGAVSRLVKSAGGVDVKLRPLTAPELSDALRRSLDGGGDEPKTENWTSWKSGDLCHVTYWLHGGYSDLQEFSMLMTDLAGVAASLCVASASLRRTRDRGRIGVSLAVRVAAESEHVAQLGRDLVAVSRSHGMRLRRCDGAQGPASYASAVSGGVW